VIYSNDEVKGHRLKEPTYLAEKEAALKSLREKLIRGLLTDPDCRPTRSRDDEFSKTLEEY